MVNAEWWITSVCSVYIIHPCACRLQNTAQLPFDTIFMFRFSFSVCRYFYFFFFRYSIRRNLDNITLPFALNELCGMHWLACFTSYINLLLLFLIFVSFCFIHSFCEHWTLYTHTIFYLLHIFYIFVKMMTWTRVPV